MKKRFEPPDWDALQNRVIGLGEQSHRKSHYSQLQERLAELERSKAVLKAERDRSQLYLDTVPVVVVALDRTGRVTMINPFGCTLLGYAAEELIGRNWFATCQPHAGREPAGDPYFEQLIAGTLPDHSYSESHLITARGGRVLVAWRNALLRDDAGGVIGVLSAGQDVTERRAAEEALHNLAFYDPLTGLPNRRLLFDRLQHSMAASARSHEYRALMFLDLDHFKNLNDTQGHDVGDLLLQEVATRLKHCVREGDTVSRLGGDEFVVLLEQLSEELDAALPQADAVGEKIVAALSAPYELGAKTYRGTASVGVVMFLGHAVPFDELLKRADLAMYQAKSAGRNTLRFFDPAMQAGITARTEMEADLRHALAAGEFALHFQPQVDGAGNCFGAEALLRWHSPTRGPVPPISFIALAEETGLILAIGRWVLACACAQLAEWQQQAATAGLTISVNVSALQFRQPGFVDEVRSLLDAHAVKPTRLRLELTESMLLWDVEEVIAKMQALRQLGVGFSLDDFGTGYSSLAYVKRLPLEELKIDKSFVRDVLVDANDAAICRAVISLGRSLGLTTLAEGVEHERQWTFLAAEGCNAAQGLLYAPPMPRAEFQDWLQRRGEERACRWAARR